MRYLQKIPKYLELPVRLPENSDETWFYIKPLAYKYLKFIKWCCRSMPCITLLKFFWFKKKKINQAFISDATRSLLYNIFRIQSFHIIYQLCQNFLKISNLSNLLLLLWTTWFMSTDSCRDSYEISNVTYCRSPQKQFLLKCIVTLKWNYNTFWGQFGHVLLNLLYQL